jgi:WhiB family redox-sensing transcriptional regulator
MSWRLRAACRGKPNWLFFDRDQETHAEKTEREATAKALCAVCPVTVQCLEEGRNLDGIWGGLTAAERRRKRRHTIVLERPFVEHSSTDGSPWTVIETTGRCSIWQRDSVSVWHGCEWGVVRDETLISVHDDLSAAYAAYGRLIQ